MIDRNEHRLRNSYAEALGADADSDLIALVGDLDALYTAYDLPERALEHDACSDVHRVPRGSAAAPTILRALRGAPGYPRWLGTLAAALMLALSFAAGGYAALPLLERVFGLEDGTAQIPARNLGEEVHLTRQVGAYSVTVQRVYADANQVVVGYTLHGPTGSSPDGLMDMELTSPDGKALAPLAGQGWGIDRGEGALVAAFDATGLSITNAAPLRLRLRADGVSYTDPDGVTRVTRGNIAFDLSVAPQRSRVLAPGRTTEVAGTSVTLERVVISPTETRIYLRGIQGEIATGLTVPGRRTIPHSSCSYGSVVGDVVCSYREGLDEAIGEWRLVVGRPNHTARYADPDSPGSSLPQGPWEFSFTLPTR